MPSCISLQSRESGWTCDSRFRLCSHQRSTATAQLRTSYRIQPTADDQLSPRPAQRHNPDGVSQFVFGGNFASVLGVVNSFDRARNMTERVIVGWAFIMPNGMILKIGW